MATLAESSGQYPDGRARDATTGDALAAAHIGRLIDMQLAIGVFAQVRL